MLSLRWKDICNIAGVITLGRLGLAIGFPFVAHDPLLAAIVLGLGAGSDVIDGMVARKMNCVSHTGGFIDGWVDKIFNINVAWSLVLFDYLPVWMAFLVFSREWFQIPLVPYYVTRYLRGHIVPNKPYWAGKWASVLLVVVFFAGLFGFDTIAFYASISTCALGLLTSLVYLEREFEVISKLRYI